MKFFHLCAAFISAFMVSSIMAAPVIESSSSATLPAASIAIIDITIAPTPLPSPPVAVIPVADAVSGGNATASITIIGKNVTAQSSGSSSDKTFMGATAVPLPIAIISAMFLLL